MDPVSGVEHLQVSQGQSEDKLLSIDDNINLQEEEVEALSSIYQDDFLLESQDPPTFTVSIRLNNGLEASLMISFGPEYPIQAPPIYQLSIPWIRGQAKAVICDTLEQLYLDHIGESIVYIWVEKVREILEESEPIPGDTDKGCSTIKSTDIKTTITSSTSREVSKGGIVKTAQEVEDDGNVEPWNPISDKLIASVSHLDCSDSSNSNSSRNSNNQNTQTTSQQNNSSPSGKRVLTGFEESLTMQKTFESSSNGCKEMPKRIFIATGEPFTDRKSTFQPHLAIVRDPLHVRIVLDELYQNKKIATATHNMYAYRIFKEETSTWFQDCDDDGETHAGSRLLHLLQILDCRNVLIVVTRWFGGIQLHGDRFKHINNVARQLLMQQGLIKKK